MDITEVSTESLSRRTHIHYILSCDIGGTHCRFTVVGLNEDKSCEILAYHIAQSAQISHGGIFINILNDFLREIYEKYSIAISDCVVASAGPIRNDTIIPTNNTISFSVNDIKNLTMLSDVLLLNDLEAMAYGVYYNRKESQDITPHIPLGEDGPFLVVAPGTGLGQATILIKDEKVNVLPMESCHMDFVIHNPFDYGLATFIKKRYNNQNPVEVEDVLSGRGLCNIFRYLVSEEKDETSIDVLHANLILDYNDKIAPMLISRYAITNNICKEALRYFYIYLARYCKNMCLTNLTTGGLFLGGGMIEHNREYLDADVFIQNFVEHTRVSFTEILSEIPIYTFTDSFLGIKGAAQTLIDRKNK